MASSNIRIRKELKKLEALNFALPGIKITTTDKIDLLYADFSFTNNPLYTSTYRLKISIRESYPFEAPICQFIKSPEVGVNSIPIHPHIYSNGHICLDILGTGWTPAQGVESLLISIHSMINGNTLNERPKGDDRYVKYAPLDPSKTHWVYHDDDV